MTVLNLLAPAFYNVQQYQAKGDGIQDDTTYIQNAFNALPATGGKIIFPQGNYKVTAQITYQLLANQHIEIEGEGQVTIVSTVPEPGGQTGIFAFTADSGSTACLSMRNIKIAHTNSGLGLLCGLYVQPLNYGSGGTQSVANIELDNVRITGASQWGGLIVGALGGLIANCSMSGNRNGGLGLTGCLDIDIVGGDYSTNVTGGLTADYGISLTSSSFVPPSKNILIIGVQANNNGRKGIDVHHGHNVHIIGNTCIGNGYIGIYAVMEDSTKDVGDITISDNTIDQTGGNNTLVNSGIHVGTFGTTGALTPGTFIVSNNRIKNVDVGTTTSMAIRVFSATTGVAPEKVIISNNTVEKGSGPTGYLVQTDNTLTIPYIEVTGNILHSVSGSGGIIIQKATDQLVLGNIVRIDGGSPVYDINVDTTGNALVIGNQLNGVAPLTAPIIMGSTVFARSNIQNGAALADSAWLAPFTITGTLTADAKGHLLALASGTPTLTSVNANVTNQSVSGNDVRGTITFDVQTGIIISGGALFTVNFAQAYGSTPLIVLVTGPSNQTTALFYVSASGMGTFVVRNGDALAVATGYKVGYLVIG